MKTLSLLPLLSLIMLSGCGKSDDTNTNTPSTQIDVSKQWYFDASGLLLTGPGDGQWKSTVFTAQESNLFASLDTADLTGTTVPTQVLETFGYNAPFPNPFILSGSHAMYFSFPNSYSGGRFVLKLVYVDSLMNPVTRRVARLQASSPPSPSASGVAVAILPAVPVGRYRLYYTLSASSNLRFYTSWGNIQCNP